MANFEGDIEQTAMYCGQSCSMVNDIRPAAEIVMNLAREAEAVLTPKPAYTTTNPSHLLRRT